MINLRSTLRMRIRRSEAAGPSRGLSPRLRARRSNVTG